MDNKKIVYGIIIGLVLVSIVFGLTQEQADIARTCDKTGITEIFDKFSDSEETGYIINPTTGDVVQYVCEKGKWIPTQEWAVNNGIKVEDIQLETSFLKPEQYEKAVTCDFDTITYVFDKFDDGAQIGYMINSATGETTQYICDKGIFQPTIKWCDDNHIDISTIQIGNALKPSNTDESGREIIYSTNPVIIADKDKQVVVGDRIINITAPVNNNTEKTIIKCFIQGTSVSIEQCING